MPCCHSVVPPSVRSLFLVAALLVPTASTAMAQEPPVLRVSHDPSAREIVMELGPIDLPANSDHHDLTQPAAQRVALPVGGWLRGFEVELVDADGRAVPREVLHHVNLIAPGARELFSEIMLRVAAAGSETAPIRLPRFLGVPIEEGDSILVASMFHNPTAQDHQGVTLRMRLSYVPETARVRPLSVYPLYLDVMPPASGHAYDLPPGRSEQSWEGSPAVSGRILGLGGHLHKYAVALRLEDVTAGKVLFETKPILDEDGNVIGMPQKRFLWRLGLPIRADHVYRLTAIYDNPTGETIPLGAMGALGGIILPSGGAWPAVQRDHPEYLLDVKLVTEGAYGDGGHGAHVSASHGSDDAAATKASGDGAHNGH